MAFIEALQTPEAALWIRVCERKEENFPLPPGRSDDALLIEVANRLKNSVREGDTVVRLGGDEFVVMLEDLGISAPEAQAKTCLLYTSPSPRDRTRSRMPSSA